MKHLTHARRVHVYFRNTHAFQWNQLPSLIDSSRCLCQLPTYLPIYLLIAAAITVSNEFDWTARLRSCFEIREARKREVGSVT
jgi:hypothetical protein